MVRKRDGYGAITLWRKHDRALLYCHHVNPQSRTRHGVNAVSFHPTIPSPTSHHCAIVVKLSRHRSIDSNLDKVIITMYLQGPIWIPRITHTYEFSGKFFGTGSKNSSQIWGTNKHVWNPLPSPSRLYLKNVL